MTTATLIADLEKPGEVSEWNESVTGVMLLDPLVAARFEADNWEAFGVLFANDVYAGTSPPNWVNLQIGFPNSTQMPVVYEFFKLSDQTNWDFRDPEDESIFGPDNEHLIELFSKHVVVTVPDLKGLPRSLNSTVGVSSAAGVEAGVYERAGLQRTSWYFHKGKFKREYSDRIEYLRREGEHEDITLSLESQSGFWQLMDTMPDAQRAEIVLLDNGNLRVFWRSENGDYVGLEVLGDDSIKVLMRRRTSSPDDSMTLHLGPGSTSEIVREIEVHGFGFSINP